jgi:hypothetical protein
MPRRLTQSYQQFLQDDANNIRPFNLAAIDLQTIQNDTDILAVS